MAASEIMECQCCGGHLEPVRHGEESECPHCNAIDRRREESRKNVLAAFIKAIICGASVLALIALMIVWLEYTVTAYFGRPH